MSLMWQPIREQSLPCRRCHDQWLDHSNHKMLTFVWWRNQNCHHCCTRFLQQYKTSLCFLCSLQCHNHIHQSFPSLLEQTRKGKTCGRCCLLRCRSFLSWQNTLWCRRHIVLMYCELRNRLAMCIQEFGFCTSKTFHCIRTHDYNCMHLDTH